MNRLQMNNAYYLKKKVTAGKVELKTPVKRNTGCICASQPNLSIFLCHFSGVFLYKHRLFIYICI